MSDDPPDAPTGTPPSSPATWWTPPSTPPAPPPTGWTPPTTPPAPPPTGWAPPSTPPEAPPTEWTTPTTTPGAGTAPPQWIPPSAPPSGGPDPSATTPPFGVAPQWSGVLTEPVPGATATAPRRRRRGVTAALVTIALIVGIVVGLVVAGRLLRSDPSTTLDVCRIAGTGRLTATGRLSDAPDPAKVTVEFRDAKGNALIHRGTTTVRASDGGRTAWTVNGQAGDDVHQVICSVTGISG